jgi:hypothetical protein
VNRGFELTSSVRRSRGSVAVTFLAFIDGSNVNCTSRQAFYSGKPVKPGIKAEDSLSSMLFHDG